MKSISIKVKLATVLASSILLGVVLFVKADMSNIEEAESNAYTLKSTATTNLNASMKAHPRASEYTSSEYTTKMAPRTTGAAEYLAVHQDTRSEGDPQQRKVVPQGEDEGQRAPQSTNSTYKTYGVRSASTRNIEASTPSTEISESKSAVVSSDRYASSRVPVATNYASTIENATVNDDAYQVKPTTQAPARTTYGGRPIRSRATEISTVQQPAPAGSNQSYGGYSVRSVKGTGTSSAREVATAADGYARKSAPQGTSSAQETNVAQQPSGENYGGYAVRSPKATNATTAQNKATTPTGEAYGGYARKSVKQGEGTTNLAQHDNAKNNDEVYQVKQAPTSSSGENFGGYAVRSPKSSKATTASSRSLAATSTTLDGYSRKSAPQGTSGQATNVAQKQPSGESYGGYAVRSAKGADVATAKASNTPSGESYGGYAVRKVGEKSTKSVAQYDNASKSDNAYNKKPTTTSGETYGGYAVRSAKGADVATAKNQTSDDETYGGYAVRSAGQKRSTSLAQTTPAVQPQKTARKGGGTPASTGIKIYDNRGQQVNLNTSQKDRSVLVMPKRGRSTAGVVIQDDPGRSIVVLASTGTQSTYRYGEIDALVNL